MIDGRKDRKEDSRQPEVNNTEHAHPDQCRQVPSRDAQKDPRDNQLRDDVAGEALTAKEEGMGRESLIK